MARFVMLLVRYAEVVVPVVVVALTLVAFAYDTSSVPTDPGPFRWR